MTRRTTLLAALALAALPAVAAAQGRGDQPKLRAALHELREARAELKDARDVWPPGYRDRALAAINDAIESVRTILAVKDVNTFRGYDRNPDYYKQYQDHPRLRSALKDLRDARDELRDARADRGAAGQLKEKALEDIDVAIGDIQTLIRSGRR